MIAYQHSTTAVDDVWRRDLDGGAAPLTNAARSSGFTVLASTARADDWVSPTTRTLVSPDGRIEAIITPARSGTRADDNYPGDNCDG